ncbi:MAG: hypothetical protein CMG41_04305 [Candidatus Marinimicrobia bacterium]|nr:hypothetical protein [Candidatus Neomarinimicrobiota bacterium]
MKTYIIIGALLSALGIVLGAFGSHSLKTKLNPEELVIYDIATRYLMYHALGIISLGILAYSVPDNVVEIPIIIMIIGIVLFSGSLYLISINGYAKLGVITPLGGTAFIVSWVLLAINIFKLP